jgi:hypothetical protein
MRPASTRLRFGGALAATSLALVFGLGGTAVAASKSASAHAGSGSDRGSVVVTEDTDTNDGGVPDGVVDAGDDAHPSGNDRSVEPGGSGTQGSAGSEPDGNGTGPERDNGGIDQADGPGGTDLADQDGNNGCGNDDDFEDDNEGNCGPRRAPIVPTTPVVPVIPVTPGTPLTPVDVTPVVVTIAATPTDVGPGAVLATELQAPLPAARVLGLTLERAPIADVAPASASSGAVLGLDATRTTGLARTGFDLGLLVVLALALLGGGLVLVRRSSTAR